LWLDLPEINYYHKSNKISMGKYLKIFILECRNYSPFGVKLKPRKPLGVC
jgi:hypothetical protein